MQTIRVYGIPPTTEKNTLKCLMADFGCFLSGSTLRDLHIDWKKAPIFFPPDLLNEEMGKKITIIVDGIFEETEHSAKLLDELAKYMSVRTHRYFPDAELVTCFVRKLNAEKGFYISEK